MCSTSVIIHRMLLYSAMVSFLDHIMVFNTRHKIIADIDQCLVNNGGCEQVCINLIPDFRCDCNVGYILNHNGFSCRGDMYI